MAYYFISFLTKMIFQTSLKELYFLDSAGDWQKFLYFLGFENVLEKRSESTHVCFII